MQLLSKRAMRPSLKWSDINALLTTRCHQILIANKNLNSQIYTQTVNCNRFISPPWSTSAFYCIRRAQSPAWAWWPGCPWRSWGGLTPASSPPPWSRSGCRGCCCDSHARPPPAPALWGSPWNPARMSPSWWRRHSAGCRASTGKTSSWTQTWNYHQTLWWWTHGSFAAFLLV